MDSELGGAAKHCPEVAASVCTPTRLRVGLASVGVVILKRFLILVGVWRTHGAFNSYFSDDS